MPSKMTAFGLPAGSLIVGTMPNLELLTRRSECGTRFFLEIRSPVAEKLVRLVKMKEFDPDSPLMDRLEEIADGIWRIHRTYPDQCKRDALTIKAHVRSFGVQDSFTIEFSSTSSGFQKIVDAARKEVVVVDGTMAFPEGEWEAMSTEIDGVIHEVTFTRKDVKRPPAKKATPKKRSPAKKPTRSNSASR